MRNKLLEQKIFQITNEQDFNSVAIEVFQYQYNHCSIYKKYVDTLKVIPQLLSHYSQIPFLPISFFKLYDITCHNNPNAIVFESSKTTGQIASRHIVNYSEVYEQSFRLCFNQFYGNVNEYIVLALLPSYLERSSSSLVFMAADLIKHSNHSESGFFLDDFEALHQIILSNTHKKILLLGVSFALLDFAEQFSFSHPDIIIMETGGMKGRKKEITRNEVHELLKKSFHVHAIHSEYGMTELLSQAYSAGNGIFELPPWMKIMIRDTYDPFCYLPNQKIGGINIIDLANVYSCSFIETQDLGKLLPENQFVVEGRFDSSDIRGCNLMYQ